MSQFDALNNEKRSTSCLCNYDDVLAISVDCMMHFENTNLTRKLIMMVMTTKRIMMKMTMMMMMETGSIGITIESIDVLLVITTG